MLQQYPVDFVHLESVWDILQSSLEVGHSQTVIYALIVLQVGFKENYHIFVVLCISKFFV